MVVQKVKFIFDFLCEALMAFQVFQFFDGLDERADWMNIVDGFFLGCLEVDWAVARR